MLRHSTTLKQHFVTNRFSKLSRSFNLDTISKKIDNENIKYF